MKKMLDHLKNFANALASPFVRISRAAKLKKYNNAKENRGPQAIEIKSLVVVEAQNFTAIFGLSAKGNKKVYVTHFGRAEQSRKLRGNVVDFDSKRTISIPQTITGITATSDNQTVISTICERKARRFVLPQDAELTELFLHEAGINEVGNTEPVKLVRSKKTAEQLAEKPVPPPKEMREPLGLVAS